MQIRARRDADIPACAAILVKTHVRDGYPRYAQHSNEAFVASPAELGAWVAVEDDQTVLGHIALHHADGDAVFALAHEATGRAASELAVVARLAVDPDTRGRGVGRRLLDEAVASAATDGKRAVLDVVTDAPAVQRFYERAGWVRVGETVIEIPELEDLAVYVYISPDPTD